MAGDVHGIFENRLSPRSAPALRTKWEVFKVYNPIRGARLAVQTSQHYTPRRHTRTGDGGRDQALLHLHPIKIEDGAVHRSQHGGHDRRTRCVYDALRGGRRPSPVPGRCRSVKRSGPRAVSLHRGRTWPLEREDHDVSCHRRCVVAKSGSGHLQVLPVMSSVSVCRTTTATRSDRRSIQWESAIRKSPNPTPNRWLKHVGTKITTRYWEDDRSDNRRIEDQGPPLDKVQH